MNIIDKFNLEVNLQVQEINIPFNSKILNIGLQLNKPVIWCLVNTDSVIVKRKLQLIYTGVEIPKNSNYISTFQLNGLVYHLFEIY